MRCDLIFRQAWFQKFHTLVVCCITDCTDDAHTFLFVFVFHGTRFHHRAHPVSPLDAGLFECFHHVDVDEVDTEFLSRDTMAFHFLHDCRGEFCYLLCGRGSSGSLDPGIRVANVFFGYPGRMA